MEQSAGRVGDQPRNFSRNQERIMEQDAKRVGGEKRRNPRRNQEMMMEQDAKRVGRQAPEP